MYYLDRPTEQSSMIDLTSVVLKCTPMMWKINSCEVTKQNHSARYLCPLNVTLSVGTFDKYANHWFALS